jgi:DNA-binding winged helix-turn-helix (wHTH) protein/TolB-like protein
METDKHPGYAFDDFVLEVGRRLLSRRGTGEPITLTAKAFDTLLYLVEHRGETLTKDALLAAVWPGVVVEENSLTQCISMLRQALGETPGENRYVATVPRKGYRFVGTVTKRQPAAAAAPAAVDPKRSRRPLWIGATAVAIVGAAAAVLLFMREGSTPPASHTLAVLPFKPLLAAERDESLELGMTQSMIASLGAHEGMSVRPMSSVRRYGAADQDPLAAGRALHVESVLDGWLRHHDDRLRVSVRLLRVSDGRQLWADEHDEPITGIIGAQDRISAKVAETLLPRITSGSTVSHTLGGTLDSAAYLAYAHGTYAMSRSTEESLLLAIGYFEQAIARDPHFALAYAGLADSHQIMAVFGMRPPSESMPRARDAVLKALQIEPRLASAYAILGQIKVQYDRDWSGAEADFARAIALDPALAEPHMYWGVLLGMRGEPDRGLAELERAQQLEPLLTLAKTRAGSVLYFARRYDEAVAQLTESLALDDRPGVAHAALGRVYLRTGRYDLALAEFGKIRGPTPGSFGDVGQALALSGQRAAAQAELDRVLALAAKRYVNAVDIASIYTALGDKENALAWLDRALQQRASTLGYLAQNPAFDVLHGDPRFASIVDRIGLWKRPLTK